MTNEGKVFEVFEAFEQKMKNLSAPQQTVPQQTEEKTAKGKLKEIFKGLKPIDFFMLKNAPEKGIKFIGEEYEPVKGKDVQNSEYITLTAGAISTLAKDHDLFIRVIDGDLYVFTGTHYELIEKEELLPNWLLDCSDTVGAPPSYMYHPKNTDYYIKTFRRFCSKQTDWEGKTSKRAINVANGIISFDEKGNAKRIDHTPELPYRYCLKYEYNPNATAPTFDKFLNEILPDEQARRFLQAYIGSIFTDTPPQKVAFLLGSGANGKSVFIDIITELLDKSNVTYYPLKTLCDEERGKDARKGIEGKLLNVCAEVGKGFDPNIFKNLSGGDAITGNLKYHNNEKIEDYARLMFACNGLPRTEDRTHGFFRRFAPIEFSVTIPPEKQDPKLKNKIKNELSGVLNWVVGGVQIFVQNGYQLPEYKRGEEIVAQYKLESDSVLLFLDEEEIKAGTEPVLFDTLYRNYKSFAIEGGYGIASKKTVSKSLKDEGFKKKRDGHKGEMYVYINKQLNIPSIL